MRSRPMRLRVGFDARAFVFPAGGIRRYASELFPAVARQGADMDLVAVDPPVGVPLPAGVLHGASLPPIPTNILRTGLALGWAVRRSGVDLFHAPAYTAPLSAGVPLVLTIHDVSYARRPELAWRRPGVLRQWYYRESARRATAIITDSCFSRDEIAAAYGVPLSRVYVVPLGVGPAFGPATPGMTTALPRGVRQPFVLHVGDLHRRRDLQTALAAVLALRRGSPPAGGLQLVCAGHDLGSASLLRQASAVADDPGALVLPGRVAEDALLALYREAVALVYPSLYEGFGLPVLEAMACGLPVIAARAGSIPEVLGEAGLFVEPGDWSGMARAIDMLMTQPDARARYRGLGLAQASRFSWARAADDTLAVYRLTAGAQAPGRTE